MPPALPRSDALPGALAPAGRAGSGAGPTPRPGPTPQGPGALDGLLWATPGLVWGASFLFIAEGLRAVGPAGLTFARLLVGFGALGLAPAARRPVARAAWPAIVLLAVVWMAFPLSMFPLAEQRVSSALTGMLNGANPLFVALVAAMLARRAPPAAALLGLGVGLLGAVLVAWPGLRAGGGDLVGVLLALSGVVSYGFALNLARPLQQAHGALPVIWRAQAVALLLTAPLGLPELLRARWTPLPLASVLALGALGTGLAYVLLAVSAGRLGATRAASTTFLVPAVALALGVLVGGEQVAPVSVVGGAVCLLGAWLLRRASHAGAGPGPLASPRGSGRG